MNIEDVTVALLDALEQMQCDYMLVGAIAAIHYGISRSTFDVDVVVQLEPHHASQLADRLGPKFRLDRQQAFEVFTVTTLHVLHLLDTPFKIDLFPLTSDPFDQQRFARRRQVQMRSRKAYLPTAEDMIVQKLRWGRNKDLDDTLDMIAVQFNELDWAYMEHWCGPHGTLDELQRLRAQIGGD